MSEYVGVIISDMTADCLRVYGEPERQLYLSLDAAMAIGNLKRGPGKCVIVRPCYNEGEEGHRYFREWRSINGSAFYSIRFSDG